MLGVTAPPASPPGQGSRRGGGGEREGWRWRRPPRSPERAGPSLDTGGGREWKELSPPWGLWGGTGPCCPRAGRGRGTVAAAPGRGARRAAPPPWRCRAGRGMGPVLPAAPFSVRPAAWGETGCHQRRQMESGAMSQSPGSPSPHRAARRRAMRGRRPGGGWAPGTPRAPEGGGGGGREGVSGRRANMADSPACERRRGGRGRPGTGARAVPGPPFLLLPRPRRVRESGGAAGSAGSGSSAAALTWRIPAEGGCAVSSPSAAGAVPRGGRPVPAGRRCLSQRAPSWGGGEERPRLHPSGSGAPRTPACRPLALWQLPGLGSTGCRAGLSADPFPSGAPSGPGGAAV